MDKGTEKLFSKLVVPSFLGTRETIVLEDNFSIDRGCGCGYWMIQGCSIYCACISTIITLYMKYTMYFVCNEIHTNTHCIFNVMK